MAQIVLFHHVQGLTDGVRAFARRLEEGGHEVIAPDLFDGARAGSIEEGLALAGRIGDEVLDARADAAIESAAPGVVVAGMSFGVMAAQRIAQTRAGVRGALLYESCLPVTGEWAIGPWPDGLPVQIHGKADDPVFAGDGDLDAARELVALARPGTAAVFTYPGDQHLFLDESLPGYDADATRLVIERSLELLRAVAPR
ncbi:dienelactone hydrolase family protein [Amnibacterium sp. CER49]|uniref:dienelactone hydrolase family protein n=1 Tax=Amnibacterium sp. CER49 TaxID=3039161 RepID=UPI0024468C7F|nr:dienelactone hydrolase family protein [Amnibacterium sp. CER49]MDH2444823.1 dienelactone hydrolase family protein [Amnibacterium sp. CER49]